MNIEQAKQALQELVKITNIDSHEFINLDEPHKEADQILCELIDEYVPNGKELTNLFKNIDKWYA